MNIDKINFEIRKSVSFIIESELAECGPASMAMVACYHCHQLDMSAMRKQFSANLKGMNLKQLIELGDS